MTPHEQLNITGGSVPLDELELTGHSLRLANAERDRKAAHEPPWTCEDCGHENPAEATFCRGCASTREDDREPVVTRPAYDPATAPLPEGF